MNNWGDWQLSNETEDRLSKICFELRCENPLNTSSDWLYLFNYGSLASESNEMETDVVDPKVDDILKIIKKSLASDMIISEELFVGISINSLSGVLLSIRTLLDELGFSTFCKNIASWKQDILVEQSLKLIVLPKLKEITEATGFIIFSLKELATAQPQKLCEDVLIPLLSDDDFQFSDTELLSRVFSVLPTPQKDLLVLTFTKKNKLLEKDFLLLHPLIKDLSQNSILNLLECIQKFSNTFTKSQVFGRFLINFCKTSNLTQNSKNILREVLKKHETLLKIQALKYLESA